VLQVNESNPVFERYRILNLSQWATFLAAAPVLLRPVVVRGVMFFIGFHMIKWALMSISSLSQVICLVAAVSPPERLAGLGRVPPALGSTPARPFSTPSPDS
jgi:hypothetical protein